MVLPIVEREFQAAARRRGTHWFRLGSAGVALFVLFVLSFWATPQAPEVLSKEFFKVLGGLALALAALAGTFLTSDCLSMERREGTLGLLFLTDLTPWDVMLGKLAATSAVAVYALFAFVPMLAVPLLMGGVGFEEFSRITLAVAVTLFCSLSAGLLASVVVRETWAAVVLTFGLIPGSTGILFLLSWGCWMVTKWEWTKYLMLPSPLVPFLVCQDGTFSRADGPRFYWGSIALISLLAVGQLVWAQALLSAKWREAEAAVGARRRRQRAEPGPEARTTNPWLWLALRDRFPGRWISVSLGALFLLWATFFVAGLVKNGRPHGDDFFTASVLMAFGLHVLLKSLLCLLIARRWSEDRRSGALELLLATPLATGSILQAHWKFVWHRFRWIFWALVGMNLALLGAVIFDPAQADRWVTIRLGLLMGGATVLLCLDLQAVRWVGLWSSLREPHQLRAFGRTVIRVFAVPWGCVLFFVLLISQRDMKSETMVVCWGCYMVISVLTSLLAMARPRRELRQAFRRLAAGENMQRRAPGQSPGPAQVYPANSLPSHTQAS
ncbi:MAG TPA: ABC transporter permease subunit [Verrucomicrobiae bacterium]|nr:ABC transporter permease subunit [Verrucomicrobiae bacterium]